MRDYRDAKAMALTLRNELAQRDCTIKVGESLELIARLFGLPDWNTLSALIKNSDPATDPTVVHKRSGGLHFAPTVEKALHRALLLGHERGQSNVTVEHLLLSLTEDPDATEIIMHCSTEPTKLRESLARAIGVRSKSDNRPEEPAPSESFQHVVQRAILDAQASGGGAVTGAHLFLAIFSDPQSVAVRILQEHGIDWARAVKFAPGRGAA